MAITAKIRCVERLQMAGIMKTQIPGLASYLFVDFLWAIEGKKAGRKYILQSVSGYINKFQNKSSLHNFNFLSTSQPSTNHQANVTLNLRAPDIDSPLYTTSSSIPTVLVSSSLQPS